MIHRGELWWADLGEPRGSAPAPRRPVVVVQAEPYNRSRLRTVIVATLTTTTRLAGLPGNVLLPASTSGLPDDSVVNVTQLAPLDRHYLDARVGMVPAWALADLDRGLRRVLAL